MKKVYVIGRCAEYLDMFKRLGYHEASSVETADLVCFTGGEDVSASLYGDRQHPHTGSSYERDMREMVIASDCNDSGIPMVGICRGAQFLNVMGGGRMYQHVEGHCRNHLITDLETGKEVYVSSTHHQMMMPSPDALLVATAAIGGSREWMEKGILTKDVSDKDIEVVFYQNIKALCFQPHPEFRGESFNGMLQYFNSLLVRFFGEK